MISASGSAEESIVTTIRYGSKKFREILPVLTAKVFSLRTRGKKVFRLVSEVLFSMVVRPGQWKGRWQLTQSELIQIYSVDWTDIYTTHNSEHRTEPVSH